MKVSWAIITGEYPPQTGGVSDYCRAVAEALAEAGDEVHVWAPGEGVPFGVDGRVVIHRLANGFAPRQLPYVSWGIRGLPQPRRVLVQYVPQAFGYKGMNLPFALWLFAMRAEQIYVMFHEVAFPLEPGMGPRYVGLGLVTRAMAWCAALAASRVFVSIPAWKPMLGSPGRRRTVWWLPVPSNLAIPQHARALYPTRKELGLPADTVLLGHFSTYSSWIAGVLRGVIPRLLDSCQRRVAVLLGRGSERFAEELQATVPLTRGKVIAPGELPADRLAAYLAACDILVQPYPDGISSRRTTAMAGLALGKPIVSTDGFLTEPLWRSSGAVVLVPVNSRDQMSCAVESVLRNDRRRKELSESAAALYARRFAIEHTIRTLRS